jgi:hypothetical protein
MSIFFAAPIDGWPDYNKVTSMPTCSTENALFPATNLITMDPTQVFQSTDATPIINWNFGAQRSFDVVCLVGTNLTDVATMSIQGSNDNVSFTSIQGGATLALAHAVAGQTVQNKSNMLRTNMTLLNLATPQTWQYLRIVPNTQIGGVVQIGRLFVGTKFVPSAGWQYGSQLNFDDMSPRQRTSRGTLVVDCIPGIRTATVKLDFLTKNEMYDFIYEFNYWRGASAEFLACLDVEDTKRLQKNLLYCNIAEGRTISFDSYNTHSSSWMLESIGVG